MKPQTTESAATPLPLPTPIDYQAPPRRRARQVVGWVLVLFWVGVILFVILACLWPVLVALLPDLSIGPRN